MLCYHLIILYNNSLCYIAEDNYILNPIQQYTLYLTFHIILYYEMLYFVNMVYILITLSSIEHLYFIFYVYLYINIYISTIKLTLSIIALYYILLTKVKLLFLRCVCCPPLILKTSVKPCPTKTSAK